MPKYDLASWSPSGAGPSWATDAGGSYTGVTGSRCLSNLVLRLLLTTKGSNPTARNEGTALGRLAGSTVDMGQLQSVVTTAVIEVETYIKKLQLRAPVPSAETLVRLVANGVTLNGDASMSVRILIYTADSTTTPLGFSI